MRITPKLLVKAFVAVIIVFFAFPLLLSKLDSKEDEKAASLRHRVNIVKKDLGFQEENAKRLDLIQKVNNDADDGKLEFRGHILENDEGKGKNLIQVKVVDLVAPQGDRELQLEQKEPDFPEVKLGPKAVFKPGILGNYEPNIVAKPGPGENGQAVYVSMEEKAAADRSVIEFGFNMVASDKISMDRNIPDTRLDECKYWQYPDVQQLPTASVIVVFHNEGWSTLMRTIHSIINTSPKELLHEVVMVDDFSDKVHLKSRLDEYLKQFNGLVKLYRNTERLGLIGTRTFGAQKSTGDVIVFLDAHCECNRNWLVPLLARIAYDRTIMAVPIIDGIDWNNFRYAPVYGSGEHFRGIFEWGFLYKESKVPQKELSKRTQNSEPYWSPTHAGGLFAMDRKYFFELGAYDPGLQIWGGENFELSFKIWQCGGKIEWVPCSRVGHVYRNAMPYGFGKLSVKIPVISLNYMRVVEVWLDDEYKEYFYAREPTIRGYPIGDISKQLEFKNTHKCKSFKWFMENIAYEVPEKFPPPTKNKAWGEIKLRQGSLCWDSLGQPVGGGAIGVSGCHHFGGNQLFRLNMEGQMGVGERCVLAQGDTLHLAYCPVQPTGPWRYDETSGLLKHYDSGRCVQAISGKLHLSTCDSGDHNQVWTINEIRTWQ